ncbi:hypothetical protein EVAR_5405_1 [Eumeta japonica]|uniref:Uncharacterized protein n=1 Tax=Eumeta variegata TaxID=151549 RepID=A0A4C1TBI3_EUMVA|nr:hypothetical protein EVAR_5405_1 [Eumeta japonica]
MTIHLPYSALSRFSFSQNSVGRDDLFLALHLALKGSSTTVPMLSMVPREGSLMNEDVLIAVGLVLVECKKPYRNICALENFMLGVYFHNLTDTREHGRLPVQSHRNP